jgi:cytochrome c5
MARTPLVTAAALAAAAFLALPASAEDFGGLPEGEGQDIVYYTCTACHSVRTFTQQDHSRRAWQAVIDRMIDDQGMAEPYDEDREEIVDYLVEHFGYEA